MILHPFNLDALAFSAQVCWASASRRVYLFGRDLSRMVTWVPEALLSVYTRFTGWTVCGHPEKMG